MLLMLVVIDDVYRTIHTDTKMLFFAWQSLETRPSIDTEQTKWSTAISELVSCIARAEEGRTENLRDSCSSHRK